MENQQIYHWTTYHNKSFVNPGECPSAINFNWHSHIRGKKSVVASEIGLAQAIQEPELPNLDESKGDMELSCSHKKRSFNSRELCRWQHCIFYYPPFTDTHRQINAHQPRLSKKSCNISDKERSRSRSRSRAGSEGVAHQLGVSADDRNAPRNEENLKFDAFSKPDSRSGSRCRLGPAKTDTNFLPSLSYPPPPYDQLPTHFPPLKQQAAPLAPHTRPQRHEPPGAISKQNLQENKDGNHTKTND